MNRPDSQALGNRLNSSESLLTVKNLVKHFPVHKTFLDKLVFKNGKFKIANQKVHAVNDVDLDIKRGETVSLVGESGCGKTTLAKTVIGLHNPTSGKVFYENREISNLHGKARKPYKKKIQIIFQDPFSSLNPRKTVLQIISQPMLAHDLVKKGKKAEMVLDILDKVGMDHDFISRYPHQFSGGQKQRIGIARALACRPDLVIADEPIAALDVSIQAQILNLMMDLQEEFGLTYLFVSHDLGVVRHISTRVAVMYLGRIVEMADTEEIFNKPLHPYTQMLFSAIPTLDNLEFTENTDIKGETPNPIVLPSGCSFHPRCSKRTSDCDQIIPKNKTIGDNHSVRCHLV